MAGPFQDGLEPEREPVQFDINLAGAPPEVMQLMKNIQDVAQMFLYRWKTFPIVLPSPIGSNYQLRQSADTLVDTPSEGGGSLIRRQHKSINIKDLFIAPSFDELDAVAMDSKGEPCRLSNKHFESIKELGLDKDKYGKPKPLSFVQLESIRRVGEFEVESINFPGQVHRWRLSEFLQKGRERTRETLLDDLALAARFLLVTAKGRLVSHYFSVRQAIKALFVGILRLFDIFIGVPSLVAYNLEVKLREERSRYLVAELLCRPENEDSMERLCSYIRKQFKRAVTEKFQIERESGKCNVPIPYVFLTPKGNELDLRLFSREIIKKAMPILATILEKETRGWFLHFRERLINELRTRKVPDHEIEREVNEAVMKEYLQKVFNSILSHPDLKCLGDGIPELFVEQAQSVALTHRAVENVRKKLKQAKEDLETRLKLNYPVKSRIGPWLRSELRKAEKALISEYQWSAHEESLLLCNNQHLTQTVYFLNRDLIFMREREPVLLMELKKVKTPTRSFQWLTQIWLPKNWVIRRNFQGTTEIIPTVLSKTPTSITTPRSDPSQPVFLVEKETTRVTTTRWPLWRWINYCHRTWAWTWNAMFLFGVVIPWCSPLSFRALFSMEPFLPDLELSQVNGTLFPRKSSTTQTFCSRLNALWRHISKSRTHFETKPDTGFIGKGLTRHLNRIWNYFFKGFLGTLLWSTLFPILCFTISLISIFIAITAILWMPAVTFCLYLFMAIFYDLDSPDPSKNKYLVISEAVLWNILLQGCFQPVLALSLALLVCPFVSLIILAVGLIRYGARLAWDTLIFHIIIKPRGRIPAADSMAVKRIAGPGLAQDYFYQIKPEQALAALEARLEIDELAAYQNQIEVVIRQPQKDFSQFVECCFAPFSAQLAKSGVYAKLEKEGQDLLNSLSEKLEKRRRELQLGLSVNVRSKIKMSPQQLKITLQQGAILLERYYPNHILKRLPISEDEFWESRGLVTNDWSGLAALLFADIFCLDFLTALDDADTRFNLEHHPGVDLSRFSALVSAAESGPGPDLLSPMHAPRGNIHVQPPFLDISVFNPRPPVKKLDNKTDSVSTQYTRLRSRKTWSMLPGWQPWKRETPVYSAEKLVIPLPIPHPVHIAVTIYNRDSDDPIPVHSEMGAAILRALEDSQTTTGNSRYTDDSYESTESPDSSLSLPAVDQPVSEWTISRRRQQQIDSVQVDLASPEDISIDTDSSRAVFSQYGTTV